MIVSKWPLAPLCAALLATCGSVIAATVDDQMAVMQAQIDLLHKQLEVRQARAALGGSQTLGLPTVLSVTVGARSVARLQLPNGLTSYYSVGESVGPGMVVSSIGPRVVSLMVGQGKDATEVPLEFEAPASARPARQPGEQPAIPSALLPPLPPVPLPSGFHLPASLQAPAAAAQIAPAAVASPAAPLTPPPIAAQPRGK